MRAPHEVAEHFFGATGQLLQAITGVDRLPGKTPETLRGGVQQVDLSEGDIVGFEMIRDAARYLAPGR